MISMKLGILKKFAIFAVILYIGLWIGGILSGFLMPLTGSLGSAAFIGTAIAFAITVIPAWFLLKKFGKKSLAE